MKTTQVAVFKTKHGWQCKYYISWSFCDHLIECGLPLASLPCYRLIPAIVLLSYGCSLTCHSWPTNSCLQTVPLLPLCPSPFVRCCSSRCFLFVTMAASSNSAMIVSEQNCDLLDMVQSVADNNWKANGALIAGAGRRARRIEASHMWTSAC